MDRAGRPRLLRGNVFLSDTHIFQFISKLFPAAVRLMIKWDFQQLYLMSLQWQGGEGRII